MSRDCPLGTISGTGARDGERCGAPSCAMAETLAPPGQTDSALLTRTDLAKALNCSKRKLDGLQGEGMPCIWIGRSRRFIFAEVVAWLRRKGSAR